MKWFRIAAVLCVLSFCGSALPLRPVSAAGLEEPDPTPKVGVSESDQKRRDLAKKIQADIRELYARVPIDYAAIANQYQMIFSLFPFDEQGKLAIWEAYNAFRRAKDPTSALAMLRRIYSTYRSDAFMANPLPIEGAKPIHMHATADIEQAMLYARFFNTPEAAVMQLHSVQARRPGAYVGLLDGDKGYYGSVGAVVWLKIAEAQAQAGQYNDALGSLRTALIEHRGESIGRPYGAIPIDLVCMRQVEDVLRKMPASLTKKQVDLDEVKRLCAGVEAKARARFVRARLFIDNYEEFRHVEDLLQAEREYLAVVTEEGDTVYKSARGEESMGVLAVLALVDIHVRRLKNPAKAVTVLEGLENEAHALGDRTASEAHARLQRATLYLERLSNPMQAAALLEDFGKEFPTVPVYPKAAGSKSMLFEVANKIHAKAREQLAASPSGTEP